MLAAALALLLQVPGVQAPPRMPAQEPDDWNLGLLGATGNPLPDGKGIRVAGVFPDGPAAAGGLQRGDEIVALAGQPFPRRADPVYYLVDAIEAVTGLKSPVLPVTVMRGGKPETLKVPFPALGKHAATCPHKCERCERMVAQSLDWIVSQQQPDGSFASNLGGKNGHVAVTSLSGLALLAGGSTPSDGPHASALRRAVRYVIQTAGDEGTVPKGTGGANWSQVNWSLGYGGAFLGLVHRRAPDAEVKAKLAAVAQAIVRNQEASGGWAHGPGGPNALNYVELEIMSNWCLLALGLARQAGVEVPQAPIDRAVAYIEACSSGGGVGYSTRQGQKGMGDPGRTAGAAVAFEALYLERHPMHERMVKFAARGFGDLYKGHVSPVMHYLAGGMMAHAAGAKTWAAFQEPFRREFLAARRPDGSFSARPTAETQKLHSNNDRQVGFAWTTASYLAIQLLARGHVGW
ncbi:MAG: DUF6288 domain-containing protein [Planctomycetales bacterium]|nr:DUF6288 domain-containing protein [Planctomycetales bacterium]